MWKGDRFKYKYLCKKHGEYLQAFEKHNMGRGCPACGRLRTADALRLTSREVYIRFPDMVKGQRLIQTTRYSTNSFVLSMGCISKSLMPHNSGHGCPACRESHGEKKVAKILESLKVHFLRQFHIPDCRNSKSLPFDFDVWVKGKPFLIEFHGEQHYEPSSLFGGKEAFRTQKHRDSIKKTFCIKNNIPLLVLKYTEKNIEAKICRFLRIAM